MRYLLQADSPQVLTNPLYFASGCYLTLLSRVLVFRVLHVWTETSWSCDSYLKFEASIIPCIPNLEHCAFLGSSNFWTQITRNQRSGAFDLRIPIFGQCYFKQQPEIARTGVYSNLSRYYLMGAWRVRHSKPLAYLMQGFASDCFQAPRALIRVKSMTGCFVNMARSNRE
jgi:hypothetical protein